MGIKKAFTLIELVITMVIMSLLIGLLFQIFIMISHIAVKIQYERGLHDEVIYVLQTVQNIIDQGDTSFNGEPADTRYGYDDVIALSGTNFNYTFSRNTTDETLELVIEDTITTTTKTFVLTNEHRVKIKEFYIKRVPFKSQSVYRNQMHEGFWLFMDVEIPAYSADKRWFRIDRNVQTFFNIRKYD